MADVVRELVAEEPVTCRTSESVARIALNRPKQLNALTAEASLALLHAFRRAAAPEIRAVVLTGTGRAFCSGSDLRANFDGIQPPAEESLRTSRHPVILAMRALPKPVICAVNGVAAGIGVGLALAGDIVVARESATFNLAFARVGLVPDGGSTWFLQRATGRVQAMRLAMLAESVGGVQAERMGLASLCVPDDEFDEAVEGLAMRLAAGPTRAFALMKQAFDAAAHSSLAEQLELEARLQAEASRTADFGEGLAAFVEKREPVFRGL